MKEITQIQRDVLVYIADFIDENSYPPTVREVSEHFGKSIRAVQDNMTALQKKGYISIEQKKSRSIKILNDVRQQGGKSFTGKLPLLGELVAGKPVLCEENFESYLTLGAPFIQQGKNYFAVRIRDHSMANFGIFQGDLAIVEQKTDAADGQVVAAVIDDAITLKRYFREAERIRLQPENPEYNPIYCSMDLNILGVLVGLMRSY